MEKFQITEYSTTVAALALLREKYGRPFDVSTPKGMEEAREARAVLRGYRVNLEKTRKEVKAPPLERCQIIDDEARQINNALVALENPIDAVIKAEEKRKAAIKAEKERAERQRIEEINRKIDAMRQLVVKAVGEDFLFTKGAISWVELYPIEPAEFLEFLPTALAVKAETLATLNKMASEKQIIDDEKRRIAELQRQIEAERQRQAEENRKIEAERQRQAEENRKIEAERQRQAEENRQIEAERQRQAEEQRQRQAEEQRRQQREVAEREEAERKRRIEQEIREREDQELSEWQRIDPITYLVIAIQYKRLTIEEALKAAYQMGVESVTPVERAA